MPKLQTLRLWRADDFLWTSGEPYSVREWRSACRNTGRIALSPTMLIVIDVRRECHGGVCFSASVRPDLRQDPRRVLRSREWVASLSTSESIGMCSLVLRVGQRAWILVLLSSTCGPLRTRSVSTVRATERAGLPGHPRQDRRGESRTVSSNGSSALPC
jgi:hypothetical protein